jgi:putative membrane protein
MNEQSIQKEKIPMTWINVISVTIPVVIAVLLGIQKKVDIGSWTKFLPHIIGLINTITSITLLTGLYFIKNKQIENHRKAMSFAFLLGFFFLLCYVTYHLTNPSTKFGGEGIVKYFYFFILISHISLSLVVLPFVLRAMFFAQTNQFDRHRKVVKFAYPFWLYVSITGVIAYLMISPYYR